MTTKTVLVLLIISCLAVVSSQGYAEVYCGRRLASALALLCDYKLIKRSETHHRMLQEDSSLPWIEADSAHSLGRKKRQVASECCDKPCTIDELLSYCGN
ncbi:bombyxin A-3 homolog [Melitaea cinxia]|uniref:bombyxin A-3 homolog n=1 Tax=Melitaea cinxia TaxID=113334 RepID=UPI001E273461|nr:bombyxin A-3 homolog [Melitaea cinxia]